MIENNYYEKYLKYKSKYNTLKKQIGGSYEEDIKYLIENGYNVYSLKNHMSDEDFKDKIKELYGFAKKNKNNILLNTILENFIYDKQKISLDLKYLVGPVSLTIYKNKQNNQTIYIFGEAHSRDNSCLKNKLVGVNVVRFIEHILINSYAFVDLYVETPLRKPNIDSLLKNEAIVKTGAKRKLKGGGELQYETQDEIAKAILSDFADIYINIYSNKEGNSNKILKLSSDTMIDDNDDKYKLIRYHAVDIRQIYINNINRRDFLTELQFLLTDNQNSVFINSDNSKILFMNMFRYIDWVTGKIEDGKKNKVDIIDIIKDILLNYSIIIDNNEIKYYDNTKLLIKRDSSINNKIYDFIYKHKYFDDINILKNFDKYINNLLILLFFNYIINTMITNNIEIDFNEDFLEMAVDDQIYKVPENIIDGITHILLNIKDYELKLKIIKIDNVQTAYDFLIRFNSKLQIDLDLKVNESKENKIKIENFFKDFITTFKGFLLRINILRHDMYTLSRIFRKFEWKERLTDKYEKFHPQEQMNIIIYTGETHSQNFRDFFNLDRDIFDKIFYKNNIIDIEPKYDFINKGCLDISEINIPLFQVDNLIKK